jgi:L-aminopeptidase/D-esterase-like protein
MILRLANITFLLIFTAISLAAQKPRARDLGVPFPGTPGPLNAITDVAGVEVGHATIISGEGKLVRGSGPVRTGVTVVSPQKIGDTNRFYGAFYAQNGNGEMTGTTWLEESGMLEGAVFITNTHAVGTVRDAYIEWQTKHAPPPDPARFGETVFSLPVVAETWDGYLNDIYGFHVKPEHVAQAIENAKPGVVPAEGGVGGGTGMICYGFKGGIGTSSRKTQTPSGAFTVGVLVQCNCGRRPQLLIAGTPVGEEITETVPYSAIPKQEQTETGSIIIVVATDAPLLPHQLRRLAHRATMGLARTGSISGNGSGDIFVAFSTANPSPMNVPKLRTVSELPNDEIDPLFAATVQATEEAIVNAMVGAETMIGVDGHKVIGLPHDRLRTILKKYNRLTK